jgi:hypothetical protein
MLHVAAKMRMRFPYAGVVGNIFTHKYNQLDAHTMRLAGLFNALEQSGRWGSTPKNADDILSVAGLF